MKANLALLTLGLLLVTIVSTAPIDGMVLLSYLRCAPHEYLAVSSIEPPPLQRRAAEGRNWGDLDRYHQPDLLDDGIRWALEVALKEGAKTARSKYRTQLLKKAKAEVQLRISRGEVFGRLNRQLEIDNIVKPKMAEFERRLQLAGPTPGEMDQQGQARIKSPFPTPSAQSGTGGIAEK